MISDMIHPISTVSARDFVMEVLPEGPATIDRAIELSAELRKTRGWYTDPRYLLEVWIRKENRK